MLCNPRRLGLLAALVLTGGLRTSLAGAQTPDPNGAAPSDSANSGSNATNTAEKKDETGAASAAAPVTPVEAPAAPTVAAPPPTEGPLAPSTSEANPPVAEAAPIAEPLVPEEPLTLHTNGWTASMYGFAEVDVIADSTRSFIEGSLNNTIARPNTVPGDNPRMQLTARNSRLGFRVAPPQWGSVKASAVVEMDFFGNQSTTTTENESYTNGPVRMRHFYAKLETPVVDVLAGQYHDLFAWGGAGFYPNTVAFLPVQGEIYHRNPQVRVSKTFAGKAVDLEIAVAAVRPAQRDAALPDGEGGIRLSVNGWKGASSPGASRPVAAPLAIGVSAIGRRLSVADFSSTPGNPQTANAGGIAADVFVPVIPAHGDDLSNAISITGEFTTGTGIADLYPGLTGGVGFPALPNPNNLLAVPTYVPNIDLGIATYDASNRLKTIDWRGLILNAHYHLPFGDGKKLWVSGTFGLLQSSNAVDLTPIQGRPYVWHKGQYVDANLWWGVTPAVQVGLSGQLMQQTYGDGTVAKNQRAEGAFYLFF